MKHTTARVITLSCLAGFAVQGIGGCTGSESQSHRTAPQHRGQDATLHTAAAAPFPDRVAAGLAADVANRSVSKSPDQEVAGDSATAQGAVAAWIWHDEGDPLESTPPQARYFRRTFDLGRPETVVLDIAADDRYEVYVNGDRAGSGEGTSTVRRYDITSRVRVGGNALAVKASNAAGPAGLLVRVLVTQRGGTQLSIRSDASWRTHTEEVDGWNTLDFDAAAWTPARVLGEYGRVAHWLELQWEAGSDGRFRVPDGFRVEQVASAELTGSVVNMTFDGKGRILLSREGGPVVRLTDADGDGVAEAATEIASLVKNCQGLLALDGDLYAVGDGPEKTGLYRLSDSDGDEVMDAVETIGTTHGGMGEHGPHAILLGPDGWLYWDLGNHAHVAEPIEPDSPLNIFVEGDLLQPRYEDAGGHAVGVKVPGGTIVRFSRDATNRKWYRVAGGFRNQFDFAFSAAGEIFTFDSDMEWDVGLPWYRPVRVNQAVPGAEFGWRSGAAKWPAYYFDSLPATVDVGRGSPTGVVFYHHDRFPDKYHDAFFISDWAQGVIHAVHLTRNGASWMGKAEAFVTGNPLNVTDVEVGPDGALYFSCGGRGTEGGIFRVVHASNASERSLADFAAGSALEVPQPESAWARTVIASIRRRMKGQWGPSLEELAAATDSEVHARIRALDLLQQYGPRPSEQLLLALTHDPDPLIRAHAVYLLGVNPSAPAQTATARLLGDSDPLVRRRACEAIVRAHMRVDPDALVALLGDSDLWVRFAAGRAIRDVAPFLWAESVLETENLKIASAGMLALLQLEPHRATLERILQRQAALLAAGSTSDDDLLDLLRCIQRALLQAGLDDRVRSRLHAGEVASDMTWLASIRDQVLARYPSQDTRINGELSRMLAFLQVPAAVPKVMARLAASESRAEQIHLALCARYIPHGWTSEHKRQLFAWFDQAVRWEGGHSFSRYIENFTRDCLHLLNGDERIERLAAGDRNPFVARLLVVSLSGEQARDQAATLIDLYARLLSPAEPLPAITAEDRALLAGEVVGALGRAGSEQALAYLRQRFDDDPDRRSAICRALAAHPSPENWDYLVRSLDSVTGDTLRAALVALRSIDRRPETPSILRAAIIAGLKLGEDAKPATELLTAWLGDQVAEAGSLPKWQAWFAQKYPDQPAASLAQTQTKSRWGYEQLVAFLSDNPDGTNGSAVRGAAVFERAQCIKCHRFGSRGEGIGPDLTTVRRRFQRKEILDSLFYPSQVISDQYRGSVVVTKAGQVKTGLVAPQGQDAVVVLDLDGNKTVIAKADIDTQEPSNTSAMPEGLLNTLTLAEIADLFAYLDQVPVQPSGASSAGQQK